MLESSRLCSDIWSVDFGDGAAVNAAGDGENAPADAHATSTDDVNRRIIADGDGGVCSSAGFLLGSALYQPF